VRLVVKYSKGGRLKYISHLDVMRTFHRSIRRASLPVAYSQGFTPHPKMSFASALSVGLTSEGEYMDVVMDETVTPYNFRKNLNSVLPLGLSVLEVVEIDPKNKSLMSMIERASFRISLPIHLKDPADIINAYSDEPYLLVTKEKGDNLQYLNIKPFIHAVSLCEYNEQELKVDVLLNSGSKSNLKPQLFLDSLLDFLKVTKQIANHCHIHRLDMFLYKDDEWITPLELVEVLQIG